MLTNKQIEEIREHLNKAQNPVFFFDNDQDGLCSFLLLQKYLGRGKGFPIKTSPALTKDYFRKVEEFNSDYIFILDKPEVEKEFVAEVEKRNIPLVWIDHHKTSKEKILKYANYYNPLLGKNKTDEPVTYICQQIANRREDLWLAVVGCISDNFVPDFYKDFMKDFPELCKNYKNAFDILYGSDIGKIARIIGFGLKDRISNVISMIKFLISSKGPYYFLEENNKNRTIHRRFEEIDKKYQKLLSKAKRRGISGNLILFKYSGDTSMSADLANGLKFAFPEKIIIVCRIKGGRVSLSIRGKNIREKIVSIIEKIPRATGGGHEDAVGAQMSEKDLEQFEKSIREIIKNP